MQKTKEVVIGEATYRLGKLSPLTASRIIHLLMAAATKASAEQTQSASAQAESESHIEKLSTEEKGNLAVTAFWLSGGPLLDENVYYGIQVNCLKVCSRMNGDVPEPLMMVDGRWAIPEVEQDVSVVNRLISESLKFNLSPFFTADALNSIRVPIPDLKPPLASR